MQLVNSLRSDLWLTISQERDIDGQDLLIYDLSVALFANGSCVLGHCKPESPGLLILEGLLQGLHHGLLHGDWIIHLLRHNHSTLHSMNSD